MFVQGRRFLSPFCRTVLGRSRCISDSSIHPPDSLYSHWQEPVSLRLLDSPSGLLIHFRNYRLLIQPLAGACESETPRFTLRTPYTALGRSLPSQESVGLRLLVSPSGLLIQPFAGVGGSKTPRFTLQTPYTAFVHITSDSQSWGKTCRQRMSHIRQPQPVGPLASPLEKSMSPVFLAYSRLLRWSSPSSRSFARSCSPYKGDGWVEFVAMSALLTVGINFIFYLIGLRQQLPPFMLLVEFIVYCVFTVFFAIAAIVAAVSGHYHASIGATAFFAFAATAIFGVDTFFQFRAWKDGQTQMTTGHTTTTTTSTNETTAQY
ncbi:hypothetical protein LSAT2_028206 [Lamellibrachia satsuma]|nr:hypothetical protein LSAT2_028206 [Lamellibrachia satsuma]